MKIFVNSFQGANFAIEVEPQETVSDLKKKIETVQGASVFPASRQMLIHQWKVLRDETTLDENKVADNGRMVIILTKGIPGQAANPLAQQE